MDQKEAPNRFADKIMVRLPDGYRNKLKVIAGRNRRSVNAELVVWIDKLLEADGPHEKSVARQSA